MKVLIIKFRNIGDVLLSTPLISNIKYHYPILKYVNYKMRKNLKKGDKELFKENIRAM